MFACVISVYNPLRNTICSLNRSYNRVVHQQQSPQVECQQNQCTYGGQPEEEEGSCPGCHPGREGEETGFLQVDSYKSNQ